MDDRGCVGRILDIADEAAVDLELVERERAQIEQARIAGTEVIEREAHPQRFELLHRRGGILDVADERAFGELELKPCGRKPSFSQDALDDGDEVWTAELQR